MAKYPVYAVRDLKVGFGVPLVKVSDEVAKRDFAQQFSVPGSVMEFSPQDFQLFKIGEYDPDTAKFDSILPEFIVDGMDMVGAK